MSNRARTFLEQWKSEHVEPIADTHRLREAVRLVTKCREDAMGAGVPPPELRAAADDDLIRNMLAALDAASSDKAKGESKEEPKSIFHRLLAHIPSAHRRAFENELTGS
jgi:hypothetical protein